MSTWLLPPYAPVAVDELLMVFPADVIPLMPDPGTIPRYGEYEAWDELADHWFFKGLPADAAFYTKPGIDGETAYRHLSCILKSYQPRHQDKMAAVAFLLQQWMEKVVLHKTYSNGD